jgi:segregation and condensation protein A
MHYHFHLQQFEGPLDLLLSLIEKEKLDITQVSLAQVADQYLEHIQEDKENISLEHLSSFLSVAARLILIKSKALLPILSFSDDEEMMMDDLEAHLRAYQRFREAAARLGELFARSKAAYIRESFLGERAVFYPPEGLSASDLRAHFLDVLGGIPVFEALPEKEIRAVITLEEKIATLQRTLSERAESSFAELVAQAKDRVEIVVSFLAVLELVKQRFIFVEQGGTFSDIRIKKL